MARCKNCPALDDPEFTVVDEYIVFGPGCPDEEYDWYGGDCFLNNPRIDGAVSR